MDIPAPVRSYSTIPLGSRASTAHGIPGIPALPGAHLKKERSAIDMETKQKPKGGCLGRVLMVLGVLFVIIIVIGIVGGNSDNSDAGPTKVGTVSPTPEGDQGTDETVPPKGTPGVPASEEPAPAETPEPEDTPEPTPAQTVFHVGDILQDGDTEIVYAASGVYQEDNEYMQPEEGQRYIFLKLALINHSETESSSISNFSFECYADGYACEQYFGGEEDLSATLSPGRSTVGYVYFTVPADAQDIQIEYETNVWTEEKITFVYDGDKDSGYTLEKDLTPTEGALQVGDVAETDDLRFTFLACYEDSSDNMFITPAEGYRYVTIELEVENLDDSDHAVSYMSFHGYADGVAADLSHFRDDTLSADLSAGRKAKGTVTFEVPVDATVIEFEYETSIWSSNPVVFNGMPS